MICKDRGHQFGENYDQEWAICKQCETQFRYENVLHERNAPTELKVGVSPDAEQVVLRNRPVP